MEKTIFYDIDTQRDFMNREGALFVSALEEETESPFGAETIKPNLALLTEYARNKGIQVMGSADRHFPGDAELLENGGPFPPHCMDEEEGQKRIEETEPLRVKFVEQKVGENKGQPINREYKQKELEEIALFPGTIIFEKQDYDVFTNPAAEKVMKLAGVEKAVVYGVATDYCDRAAVLGMLKRGIEVYLVTDAIKEVNINFQGEVDPEFGQKAIDEMVAAGAKLITTQEVLEGKYQ